MKAVFEMNPTTVTKCLEACVACARACEQCGEACLSGSDFGDLADCLRLDRDCAQLCWTTAALLGRNSQFAPDLCWVCADLCDTCAAECEHHDAEHCRRCAAVCRQCARVCRELADAAEA